jgi:hypothetical protein
VSLRYPFPERTVSENAVYCGQDNDDDDDIQPTTGAGLRLFDTISRSAVLSSGSALHC